MFHCLINKRNLVSSIYSLTLLKNSCHEKINLFENVCIDLF